METLFEYKVETDGKNIHVSGYVDCTKKEFMNILVNILVDSFKAKDMNLIDFYVIRDAVMNEIRKG